MNALEPLANPAVRLAVSAELYRLASMAERHGKRAEKAGNYRSAVPNFQLAAWRERAAKALAEGTGFDPRDRGHVEDALRAVQVRMTPVAQALRGGVR